MTNNKKNLTILIPIYNLNYYLDRVLSYLDKNKCNFKIFISDGSKTKLDEKIFKKKYRNLKISYNYFGYDNHYSRFLKKMYRSLKKIDTKYIYWLCDDDFVSLNVLNFGLKKLNNSKLIFFGGRVKNFSIADASNIWSEIKMENYQYNKLSYKDIRSFKSSNLIHRLKVLRKFQPYEGIISRKVLLSVFHYANKLMVKNAHDFALLFKTIPLISGSIYQTNRTILFRQVNVIESQGSNLASDHKSSIKKYFEANLYNLSNNLIKIIKKKKSIKKNDTLEIKLIFNKYIRRLSDYLLQIYYYQKQKDSKKISYKTISSIRKIKNSLKIKINFKKNINKNKYFEKIGKKII